MDFRVFIRTETMPHQTTYGEKFLQHLTALARQTPYQYKDLQQIKTMEREDLAERLKSECPDVARLVQMKSPEEVAELVHRKRSEIGAAVSGSSTAQGVGSLLDLVVQLFAASV